MPYEYFMVGPSGTCSFLLLYLLLDVNALEFISKELCFSCEVFREHHPTGTVEALCPVDHFLDLSLAYRNLVH